MDNKALVLFVNNFIKTGDEEIKDYPLELKLPIFVPMDS